MDYLCIYRSFETIKGPQHCANIPFVGPPPSLNARGTRSCSRASRARERLAQRRGWNPWEIRPILSANKIGTTLAPRKTSELSSAFLNPPLSELFKNLPPYSSQTPRGLHNGC